MIEKLFRPCATTGILDIKTAGKVKVVKKI
jgi:hypothetical protein